MDPLLLALLGGGALLAILGLRKSSSSSQAQSQVQQGAAAIDYAGSAGTGVVAQNQQLETGINSNLFKTEVGAAAGGASAGAAAAGAASTGAGITAGAVTFGIGALAGLAVALWAKHEARIKGAKTENAAMNIIAPGWVEAIQGIIAQYNAGTINDLTTVSELKQLRKLVYDDLLKYNHEPGVNWSGGGNQPGIAGVQQYWTVKCSKHCTIGCCIFNNVIGPVTNNAMALVSHRQVWVNSKMSPWQNTIYSPTMPGYPKYGFKGISSFPLTVNK